MRTAVLGALIGAGLVMAAVGAVPEERGLFAQRMDPHRPAQAEGGLIALSTVVADEHQQVTVIDPNRQAMSVYHIDFRSGAIELKSVRQIHWDLQIADYNGKGLLPREIQSQLQLR